MLDSQELGEEQILAALMGITEMMGDLTDLDELLETIVRIAPRLVSVNRCAIFLRNPRAPEFRVAHAFSPSPAATETMLRLSIPQAEMERLAHKLIRQRVPVLLREARESFLPATILETLKIRSMLLVPLEYQEQVMGFMTLDEPGKDHVFTSREVNVVQAIASHAAVALVHTRLVDAYRIERRRSEALSGALCDGVIALDPHLRIASMNAGAESLLGWRSEDLEGKSSAEALGVEATDLATRVLAGSSRTTGIARFRARDGSPVACMVTAAPVLGGIGGGPVEILYALTRVDPDAVVTTRRPARTEAG